MLQTTKALLKAWLLLHHAVTDESTTCAIRTGIPVPFWDVNPTECHRFLLRNFTRELLILFLLFSSVFIAFIFIFSTSYFLFWRPLLNKLSELTELLKKGS